MTKQKTKEEKTETKICPGCEFSFKPVNEKDDICPKCRSNGIIRKTNEQSIFSQERR